MLLVMTGATCRHVNSVAVTDWQLSKTNEMRLITRRKHARMSRHGTSHDVKMPHAHWTVMFATCHWGLLDL